MPEVDEDIVLPVSGKVRLNLSEAQRRSGLSRSELMAALLEWFARQGPAVQESILCADRLGGSDLSQTFHEWTAGDE